MRFERLTMAMALVAGTVVAGAPSATAAPSVPVDRMLRPVDAGAGYRVSAEEVLGDWNFGYTVSSCQATTWTGVEEVAVRGRELTKGEPGVPGGKYVSQEVRRYASAPAARVALTDVRRNARACPEFAVTDVGTGHVWGTMRISVVANGFAGAGSILLRESYTWADTGEVRTHLRIFVRDGRLLTEISPSTQDEATAIRLGARAAARLDA